MQKLSTRERFIYLLAEPNIIVCFFVLLCAHRVFFVLSQNASRGHVRPPRRRGGGVGGEQSYGASVCLRDEEASRGCSRPAATLLAV